MISLERFEKRKQLRKVEKGDYRGILFLSVPRKVLNRIMLERMKKAVDIKLKDN